MDSSFDVWKHFHHCLTALIYRSSNFLRMVPGLKDLCHEDQMCLANYGAVEVRTLPFFFM